MNLEGQTRQSIVGVLIHCQPRQEIVAFQNVSHRVCGEWRVKRMDAGLREVLIDVFVGILVNQRAMQMQRTLQKHRIHILQVGTIGPEPWWHFSDGGR